MGEAIVASHGHHPVRRRGLRHAAVRAGLRARRDAGPDELRQPGARRLRHGRRLRHRDPDGPLGRAVPRLPAGGVRGGGGAGLRARAHALRPHVRPHPSRPGAVLDRPGVHGGGRRRLGDGLEPAATSSCRPGCRAGREMLGVNVGHLPLLHHRDLRRAGARPAARADAHALRQPPARRRRRCPRGARARHPGRHGLRRHLRRRLGPRRPGRRAGRRSCWASIPTFR